MEDLNPDLFDEDFGDDLEDFDLDEDDLDDLQDLLAEDLGEPEDLAQKPNTNIYGPPLLSRGPYCLSITYLSCSCNYHNRNHQMFPLVL